MALPIRAQPRRPFWLGATCLLGSVDLRRLRSRERSGGDEDLGSRPTVRRATGADGINRIERLYARGTYRPRERHGYIAFVVENQIRRTSNLTA